MDNAGIKTERVIAALAHREADRVPVGEFFWTNFLRRCRKEFGDDFNPYKHWDIDLIVVTPNMDPHITGIQVLEDSPDRKVVRTGFGATIERRSTFPMPHYKDFDTQTLEQMEALAFDDPRDPRRYHAAIDDQINAVGDELVLGLPSFVDRVNSCANDFCVFGSVCEPHEMVWRIMGTENVLMKLAEAPGRMARFIARLGDFLAAHAAGLKTIYHGCGNASAVFEDMIEAGVDAYNPLEAKAGLDVVDLKRRFGRRWAFNGNIDVRVLATNDREKVRREVLTKLNAAKGGGYIFQSDHSVPDNVAPATYEYVMQLVREHGRYPLNLGEFDQAI
ncbi:MAG: hypothetical protein NTX87_09115 [Planctomycetota bacterium]|nr:hypothetical protein [Planctomycetota bacterium]